MNERRVVVTGAGVICALGADVPTFWRNLAAGECGIREITLFDTTGFRTSKAGEVNQLDLTQSFPPRMFRRLSRCDCLALIACREALRSAGFPPLPCPEASVGVILGAGAGGMLSAEKYREQTIRFPGRRQDPSLLVPFSASNITDLVAMEVGAAGPRSTVVTACSSSATAIGYAGDLIRQGRCQTMIAGGSEALSRLTFAGFNALRSIDPGCCQPFDLNRKGLSLGEGAAMIVLEDLDQAIARSAPILAELCGYGISCDAYHMTAPDANGDGAIRCMRAALQDAGVPDADIGHINAHGTATRFNDIVETRAIKEVFGERAYEIPVCSVKSMIGHCLGAAGAVEALALVLSIQHGIVPPTINYQTPDPQCDLDYVPNVSRPLEYQYGLSNSFAFGGNNTSLVFARYRGETR